MNPDRREKLERMAEAYESPHEAQEAQRRLGQPLVPVEYMRWSHGLQEARKAASACPSCGHPHALNGIQCPTCGMCRMIVNLKGMWVDFAGEVISSGGY